MCQSHHTEKPSVSSPPRASRARLGGERGVDLCSAQILDEVPGKQAGGKCSGAGDAFQPTEIQAKNSVGRMA
jgi:hypothetical protein